MKRPVNERKLSSQQKKAILIAIQMSGNMTGATKKIEKIKKGLSKDKKVAGALRLSNESINEAPKELALRKIIRNEIQTMMGESTKEYEKSLKKIASDKKLNIISKKDKATLLKIAKLLRNER